MTGTSTFSAAETFTVVHARHIAAKIATDLLRLQRLHGLPHSDSIDKYEAEAIELLKGDYVERVTYGFCRNGLWVLGLSYKAVGGVLSRDDDPGRVGAEVDLSGTSFYSYLVYSATWFRLSEADRKRIQATLPFARTSASERGVENGYWQEDLSYAAGGRGLTRSTIKRFS